MKKPISALCLSEKCSFTNSNRLYVYKKFHKPYKPYKLHKQLIYKFVICQLSAHLHIIKGF